MKPKNQPEKCEPISARLVLSTFPDIECARQIGTTLLDAQLIACINLIPSIESLYRWKGEVTTDAEVLGIMKTTELALPELEQDLKKQHPYEVPEFLVLAPDSGSEEYLAWISNSIKTGKNS